MLESSEVEQTVCYDRYRSYYSLMSIDSRYQGFLCDIITLFQELAVRYISQKQIDLNKFKFYFNKFYDRMEHLEASFHQNKLKITKYLRRLKENCIYTQNSSRSFDGLRPNADDNNANKPISKPFVRSISTSKPTHISKELNSIEQEEDQYQTPINNRRSETAGGYRNRAASSSGRGPNRPQTGKVGGRSRYMDTTKISKTINVGQPAFCNTEQSQSNKQFSRSRDYSRYQYVMNQKEILTRRKDFYADLEKEKSQEAQVFSSKEYLDIFKKQKGKANKRLWQKINRLI